LMKSAMVKCYKDGLFDRVGFPMLTVHDELDFSIADTSDEKDYQEILHIMETALKFAVPMKVEVEIGSSWGKLEKVAR
jgi:DNA polymerase I-like protein with 3'-5' exonuclease and polymerase domains